MIACERGLDLKDAPCRGGDLLSGLLAKRDRAASETVYIEVLQPLADQDIRVGGGVFGHDCDLALGPFAEFVRLVAIELIGVTHIPYYPETRSIRLPILRRLARRVCWCAGPVPSTPAQATGRIRSAARSRWLCLDPAPPAATASAATLDIELVQDPGTRPGPPSPFRVV